MDNLSVHKGEQMLPRIEARGCTLLFLPAYSPDFNRIEGAFSKLKAFLRCAQARTIKEGLATISPANIQGIFTHCGYGA